MQEGALKDEGTVFSKETQLFSVDFSWGPGSGSCNLGSWEIKMMHNPRFTGIHSCPKEKQLQKCCVSFGKDCRRTKLYPSHSYLHHSSFSFIDTEQRDKFGNRQRDVAQLVEWHTSRAVFWTYFCPFYIPSLGSVLGSGRLLPGGGHGVGQFWLAISKKFRPPPLGTPKKLRPPPLSNPPYRHRDGGLGAFWK